MLDAVLSGLQKRQFFDFTIEQAENFTINTDGNKTLPGLHEYTIWRDRRQDYNNFVNVYKNLIWWPSTFFQVGLEEPLHQSDLYT